MIFFLCTELKKILVSEFFFKFNNYFFSTGTPTTNKLDDGITSIQNGIIWKLTFLLSGSQWENYEKSTKIRFVNR